MLELSPITYKERLWISSAVAFALHSFVISAIAFGYWSSQNGTPQTFCAEMIFEQTGSTPQEVTCVKPRPFKQQTKKSISKSHPLVATTQSSSGMSALQASEGMNCEPVYNPPPLYPTEARRKKMEGVVHIRLSVSNEGTVHKATVIPPRINPLLEEAALQAVRHWKFKPQAITLEVPIEFKLET